MSDHRLSSVRPIRYDPDSGEFAFDAVALPRAGLRVLGSGWSCRPQPITDQLRSGAREIYVEVLVRRRRQVSGRVVDELGRSVAGARILLQLHQVAQPGATRPEELLELGYGFTIGGQPDGSAALSIGIVGISDESGAFTIEGAGDLDWPATLVVVADASAIPWRTEVRLGDALDPIAIRRSSTPTSVRILDSNGPVVGAEVILVDLTDRCNQLVVGTLCPDSTGGVSGAWFETGRDYALLVCPEGKPASAPHLIRWKGEVAVDLSKLRSNLTDFDSDLAR